MEIAKGTEFKYTDLRGETAKCFVGAIDPKVGITCMGNWDKDPEDKMPREFICVDININNYHDGVCLTEDLYAYVVMRIRQGSYSSRDRNAFFSTSGSRGEMGACAFVK